MNYYRSGKRAALIKLGMAADVGVIPYAHAGSHDTANNANTRQLFWKNFDDKPVITGEESSLGMPSPSKTGSSQDYAYGASEGPYAQGGFDANQDRVDRDKRNSDAMQAAFTANEQYDQSYAPEASATQPYGPKLAAAVQSIAKPIAARTSFSMPRLGGQPRSNVSSGMYQAPTIKPPSAPTAQSPQHTVARNAAMSSRANVHAQQPNAVGAVGSRISTTPTVVGGAPVNPVPLAPKIPDATTTAQAGMQ